MSTIEKIKSEKRMKAFLKSKIGKEFQWNVQNVMGDEHKGIIKWTGDIGVEHGLCLVHKSGEILSKYREFTFNLSLALQAKPK